MLNTKLTNQGQFAETEEQRGPEPVENQLHYVEAQRNDRTAVYTFARLKNKLCRKFMAFTPESAF